MRDTCYSWCLGGACKGGADGGCRHIVACLFEVSQYAEEANINSVTSGPCQWKKKPRINDEKPVAISDLNIRLPSSSTSMSSSASCYDPCPGQHADVEEFYEGIKKLYPDANILLNRYRKEDLIKTKTVPQCEVKTIMERVADFVNDKSTYNYDELISSIKFKQEEIIEVEKVTRGQSDNKKWSEFRQGMITASNFKKVYSRRDTTDPAALVKYLIEGTHFKYGALPDAIKWGKTKESVARAMFVRIHSQEHGKLVYKEQGLIIDTDIPFLGASPDGLISCKSCGEFLIEIKCPFSKRNFYPKHAALDNSCFVDKDKKIKLKDSSYYYAQIQGQLAIAGLKLCKLIIYTVKGIQVVDVEYSETFWAECRNRLCTFFKNALLPELVKLQSK